MSVSSAYISCVGGGCAASNWSTASPVDNAGDRDHPGSERRAAATASPRDRPSRTGSSASPSRIAKSAAAAPVASPSAGKNSSTVGREDRAPRPRPPTVTATRPQPGRAHSSATMPADARRPAPAARPGTSRRASRRRARAEHGQPGRGRRRPAPRRRTGARSSPYQVSRTVATSATTPSPEPAGLPRVEHLAVPGPERDEQRPQQLRQHRREQQRHEGQAEAGGEPAATVISPRRAGERAERGDREQRPGPRTATRASRGSGRAARAPGSRWRRRPDGWPARPGRRRRTRGPARARCRRGAAGSRVHVGRPVLGRVVDRRAVDVGGVEPGEPAGLPERGEVGVVGQDPVDLDGEAGADRVRARRRRRRRPRPRCRATVSNMMAGPLEPRASKLSTTPPSARERVLADERLGPAQARLLGVGEHEHDVVARRGPARQRPGGLQQRGTPAPSSLAP